MENTMQPSLPLQHQQHPEHLRQRQRCRQRCVLFTLPSRSGAVPACCTPALSVPMQINLVFCSHCLGKSREGELTSFKRDLKNKLSAQLGTEESQAELCLAKTAPIPSYTLQPTQKQLHNKPCSQPDHHLAVSGMFRGCHHAAHTHTHTDSSCFVSEGLPGDLEDERPGVWNRPFPKPCPRPEAQPGSAFHSRDPF